jgi:hypothetical protein
MSVRNGNGSVPPFVDEDAERQKRLEQQGRVNTAVMVIGWAGLTIAMLGGAKVLGEYFLSEPNPSDNNANQGAILWAQVIVLLLTYLVGWVVTLFSIRKLHNIILPLVVRFYSFFVVGGILFVYGRAIYKLFFEQELTHSKYSVLLVAGYFALVSLHLLVEDLDLVALSFPLMLAAFAHLLAAVFHYVFTNPQKPEFVSGDLFFLGFIVVLIILLQLQWLYRPLQRLVSQMFSG